MCSRGTKCGLQHVLRAGHAAVSAAKEEGLAEMQVMSKVEVDLKGDLPEEGGGTGFDDGASWIGVPSSLGDWDVDQGAPAGISGDEHSVSGDDVESEDVSSDDEDDDEDDEGEEAVPSSAAVEVKVATEETKSSDGKHPDMHPSPRRAG